MTSADTDSEKYADLAHHAKMMSIAARSYNLNGALASVLERCSVLLGEAAEDIRSKDDLRNEIEQLRKKNEKLAEALELAGNRMHRLSVEMPIGSQMMYTVSEWTGEARAALRYYNKTKEY